MAEYQGLVDRATNVANQPYQPYQGELVAPLTDQTLSGLGGINQYANSAQPYLGAAGAMTMAGSSAVNPAQFQGMGSLSQFMNPFTSSVVGTTQNELNNQNQQQAQFLNSANISSGAFGGDRAGIGQSILANQQQLAEAPTIAGLNQANFTQAMGDWQNQQGVNLAAQQANQARLLSGASQMGQIGESAQQAGLQGSQAQIQAGMIPQQEQQAIDTAAQGQYQTGQAYPFTTTGWLGNIIEGTGAQSGGTSQTTSPAPNTLGQIAGAGMQGLGMLGSLFSLSDVRAKENVEEIGKTYDGKNIYRYNFKGDPRTQIGLLAQEEAYHDPGNVKRIGFGDLLGIDYEGATDEAADRGHFADGGAPPPGGMSQGVTQGVQGAQPMSGQGVDYALMMSGDPSARSGLGSMSLLGGTNMRPRPPLPLASQPRQGFQSGGVPAPAGLVGPGGAMGIYTGWQPGDQLSSLAGVNEALFGEETAGSKNPYTGIDFDQAEAIGGGQWMPPVTNSPMPDWQNLQNSPQFGAAEASLAGPDAYGMGSGATAPAANSGMGGGYIAPAGQGPGGLHVGEGGPAAATPGGLSRGALNQLGSQFLGGGAGGGGGGGMGAGAGGGASYVPGSVPAGTNTLSKPAPAAAAPPPAAPQSSGPGGLGIVGFSNQTDQGHGFGPDYEPIYGNIGGGGMAGRASDGRAGFQRGGFPQFTTYSPGTSSGANKPTYTALDLSRLFGGGQQPVHPAIAVQRQLQGQARAKAAASRGIVKPRIIAPDPVTGQHHDITPPDHPSTARYPGWPTPGPADPSPDGLPMTAPRSVAPVGGQAPQSMRGPLQLSSRGPGMGYPSLGMVPAEAAGTPEGMPLTRAAFWGGLPKEELPATRSAQGEEGSEPATGRPLMAPKLVGADPAGQHSLLGPHAFTQPSGDEAPSLTDREDFGLFGGRGSVGAMAEAQGGRVLRWNGGRLSFQDGGASSNMPFPGQEDPTGTWAPPPTDYSKMSDADFAAALKGDMSSAPSSNTGWIDKLDWGQHAADVPSASARPMASHIPPASLSGASGQGGYRGDVTSLMGGPPITAGHFVPTTGNARGSTYVPGSPGAGISPNARAQAPAPVHPAIAMARHIARQRAGPSAQPTAPGVVDPEILARSRMLNRGSEWGGEGTSVPSYSPDLNADINPHGDAPPDVVQHFQGGGGVMGSSPVMNAGGYTPQGEGMTGQTSQGEGLGSFATSKAASGFGDLFGGGTRAGFQSGGEAGVDPFLAAIQASSPQHGGGGGMGPPQPPKPPEPPSGGGNQPGSPGDVMSKASDVVKQFKANQGVQTSPTGLSPQDMANLPTFSPADQSAMNDPNLLSGLTDEDLGSWGALPDTGFATGGGVGLGSLRGNFQEGGEAAGPQDDPAWDQSLIADIKGAPGGSGNAPAPAPTGGKGGGASPNLTYFGDRAGYASTISRLESGSGKNYVGDDNSSFGPFQLHMGGISEKYPHPGLGDTFREQTGFDPRDPSTVDAQSKFVADYTAKHGWNDWSTKGQADKIAGGGGGANVPAADVQPAQASTESYGGGFRFPGSDQAVQQGQMPTMGSELRRDPFGYMMTVGAGMMASRSPWLGTQVGEGLVAGNKYLGSMQELESKWGLNQANINNLSAEAREHDADAGLKLNQLDIARRMAQIQIQALRDAGFNVGSTGASTSPTGAPGSISGGVGNLGPLGSKPAAGGPPGGGAAAPAGGPSAAAPTGGPSAAAPTGGPAPVQTADAGQGPSPAPTIGNYTSDPNFLEGQRLIKLGGAMNLGGGTGGNAFIDQGKNLVEAAKAEWEANKAPIQAGQEEEQKAYVGQRKDENEEVADRTGDLKTEMQNLEALRELMKRVPTGWATTNFADAQNVLSTMGIHVGDPAAVREFVKYTTSDMWNNLKEQKGAVRNKEMDAASKMNLDPDAPPEANAEILAKQMGLARFQLQYAQEYRGWDKKSPGNVSPTGFKTDWMLGHDISKYVNNERLGIAYKGQKIPTKGQLTPGQLYQLPSGKLVRAKDASTVTEE